MTGWIEKRVHQRFELSCPVVITDSHGKKLLRTQTLNISDGGAMLAEHDDFLAGDMLQADMKVPRSTPNTFLMEDVPTNAMVVRHQNIQAHDGMAIAFIEPLSLKLEE
jgi:hypothetical protein